MANLNQWCDPGARKKEVTSTVIKEGTNHFSVSAVCCQVRICVWYRQFFYCFQGNPDFVEILYSLLKLGVGRHTHIYKAERSLLKQWFSDSIYINTWGEQRVSVMRTATKSSSSWQWGPPKERTSRLSLFLFLPSSSSSPQFMENHLFTEINFLLFSQTIPHKHLFSSAKLLKNIEKLGVWNSTPSLLSTQNTSNSAI